MPKTAGVKQCVDRVAVIFLHTLWEACRHYCLRVMRGINADNIQQIGRAHRPAKLFFHHFIDFAEIRAVAQQLTETGEIGEQHAVNKEAGAVVDYNRRLAHFAGPGDDFGNGFV